MALFKPYQWPRQRPPRPAPRGLAPPLATQSPRPRGLAMWVKVTPRPPAVGHHRADGGKAGKVGIRLAFTGCSGLRLPRRVLRAVGQTKAAQGDPIPIGPASVPSGFTVRCGGANGALTAEDGRARSAPTPSPRGSKADAVLSRLESLRAGPAVALARLGPAPAPAPCPSGTPAGGRAGAADGLTGLALARPGSTPRLPCTGRGGGQRRQRAISHLPELAIDRAAKQYITEGAVGRGPSYVAGAALNNGGRANHLRCKSGFKFPARAKLFRRRGIGNRLLGPSGAGRGGRRQVTGEPGETCRYGAVLGPR